MNQAFAMDRIEQSSFDDQENLEYVSPISENGSGYLRPISPEKIEHVTPMTDTAVVEPSPDDEVLDQDMDLTESFDKAPSQGELQDIGCSTDCGVHGFVTDALKGENLEAQNVTGTGEDNLDHVMPAVEQEKGDVSHYKDLKQVKLDAGSDKHFYQKLLQPKSG